MWSLVALPLLLVSCASLTLRTASLSTAVCPLDLSCNSALPGHFSDPPEGHLRVAFTGQGPGLPETCRALCRSTKGCGFWMYYVAKRDGECKLWELTQNPCLSMSPTNAAATFFTPLEPGRASTVVGGYCSQESGTGAALVATVSGEKDQERGTASVRSECPRLLCNSPHYGFLYDHPSRGHLLSISTGQKGQPISCYTQCRETPRCAFWRFDMESELGDCTLWNVEQSPCLPEPGSDDPGTAHYDPHPAHGSYVVGGYCKIPTARSEDSVE